MFLFFLVTPGVKSFEFYSEGSLPYIVSDDWAGTSTFQPLTTGFMIPSPAQTDIPFLSTGGGIVAVIVVPAILGCGVIGVVVLLILRKKGPIRCSRENASENWRDPMKYVIAEALLRA
jgi:hypothetical protein